MSKKSVGGQKRKARPRLAKIIPIRPKQAMAAAAKRVPHLPQTVTLQQYHEKLAGLEVDILTLLASKGPTAADAARALVGVLMKIIHTNRLPYDEVIMMALINRQMLSMTDLDVADPEDAG